MKDPLPQGTELTRTNLVEQLLIALPSQQGRFSEESWEHEQPDGSYGYYGVIEEFLTRSCIVLALTGEGSRDDLGAACQFVERMLASNDDEVRSAAAISVGEPLGWNGSDLARAVFESSDVTLAVKELVWPYSSAARDTPAEWSTGKRPFS